MHKIAAGIALSTVSGWVSSDSAVRNTGGAEANRTHDRAHGANSFQGQIRISRHPIEAGESFRTAIFGNLTAPARGGDCRLRLSTPG